MPNIEGPEARRAIVRVKIAMLCINSDTFTLVFITHTIKAPEFIASYLITYLGILTLSVSRLYYVGQKMVEVHQSAFMRLVKMRVTMVQDTGYYNLPIPSTKRYVISQYLRHIIKLGILECALKKKVLGAIIPYLFRTVLPSDTEPAWI